MSNAIEREQEYQVLRKYLKTLASSESTIARNLSAALNDELTKRQQEEIYLYYIKQMRMQDIALSLGISVSSVSRTIGRGRERLKRCMRYGGANLLSASLDTDK